MATNSNKVVRDVNIVAPASSVDVPRACLRMEILSIKVMSLKVSREAG